MLKTILLINLFILSTKIISQPFGIGDQLPATKFNSLINYDQQEINLHKINKKLIILDFWGTGCRVCIEAFPTLDTLQKQFAEDVQFIGVNTESKDSITRFLAKHKKIHLPAFPFITGDSILQEFFPHASVPHHVWLNTNGKVLSITTGHNTNHDSIADYLKGDKIKLPVKSEILDYDYTKPVIVENDGRWLPYAEYYSYIFKGLPNIKGLAGLTDSNHLVRQSSIEQLIITAFEENGKYNFRSKGTRLLNVASARRYVIPQDRDSLQDWRKEHLYLYELKVPPSKSHYLYATMQQDLLRFFQIEAKIIYKKISCLELDKIPASLKDAKTVESDEVYNYNLTGARFGEILNQSFYRKNLPPVLVSPNIKEVNAKIRISAIEYKTFSLTEIISDLNKSGYTLNEVKKLMPVLLIKEPAR